MNQGKLDNLELHIAVNAVIKSAFDQAVEAFKEADGQGKAWDKLQTAMWAYHGLSDKALVDSLREVGVGNWTDKLATMNRSK